MKDILRVSGLVKMYKSTRAVNAAQLTVRSGEIAAVLGAAGSGKSTLMRLICGLERADEGNIMLSERELTSLPDEEFSKIRQRSIGVIQADAGLMSGMTLAENAAVPLAAAGVSYVKRIKRSLELFRAMQLNQFAGMYPEAAGEFHKSAAAYIRAIIASPELLIADDCTKNLNKKEETAMMRSLKAAVKTSDCGLLLLTDDPALSACADRVYSMRYGKIQEVVK